MAKIKLTKTELKHQRDSLSQFKRFLPTLQLKKQQLQMEMQKCSEELEKHRRMEEELKASLDSWVSLFSGEHIVHHLGSLVKVKDVSESTRNIAGVEVPVFVSVTFDVAEYDLFHEELWIDNAVEAVKKVMELRVKSKIVKQQAALLAHELRVTSQRVNLFEKVKIPESLENIRKIQIYLGDMNTAAVGRSKIAKGKLQAVPA
jgi:V/A-type H+-transporting ATPase subunit D